MCFLKLQTKFMGQMHPKFQHIIFTFEHLSFINNVDFWISTVNDWWAIENVSYGTFLFYKNENHYYELQGSLTDTWNNTSRIYMLGMVGYLNP